MCDEPDEGLTGKVVSNVAALVSSMGPLMRVGLLCEREAFEAMMQMVTRGWHEVTDPYVMVMAVDDGEIAVTSWIARAGYGIRSTEGED